MVDSPFICVISDENEFISLSLCVQAAAVLGV